MFVVSFFNKLDCSFSFSASQIPWLGAESYAELFLRSPAAEGAARVDGVDARLCSADVLVDEESIVLFVGVEMLEYVLASATWLCQVAELGIL